MTRGGDCRGRGRREIVERDREGGEEERDERCAWHACVVCNVSVGGCVCVEPRSQRW